MFEFYLITMEEISSFLEPLFFVFFLCESPSVSVSNKLSVSVVKC